MKTDRNSNSSTEPPDPELVRLITKQFGLADDFFQKMITEKGTQAAGYFASMAAAGKSKWPNYQEPYELACEMIKPPAGRQTSLEPELQPA